MKIAPLSEASFYCSLSNIIYNKIKKINNEKDNKKNQIAKRHKGIK